MKKHFGMAFLGGLILAAAAALPSLSHAMQLGLDLDSSVKVNVQNKHNGSDTDAQFNSGANIGADAQPNGRNDSRNDENQNSDSNSDQEDAAKNDENRSGFFGRVWAMFQGNTDKNNKDADNNSDVVVSASTTVDADVSVDGPKIYWLRASTVRADSATILWVTTERTTGRVWLEKDDDIDMDLVPTQSDDSFSYFHKLKVNNLEADTTYHLKVASTDKDGNTTISTLSSFTTKVE
jgi:hypothetical protein